MNTYQAMLKAADHIDRNPSSFSFHRIRIPKSPHGVACAIGWVQHYRGFWARFRNWGIIHTGGLGVKGSRDFYARLDEFEPHWILGDGHQAARALRRVATKYYAPLKPERNFAAEMAAMLSRGQTISTEARSEELAW